MDQRQFATVMFAVLGVFVAVSRLPEVFSLVAVLSHARTDDAVWDTQRRWMLVALLGTVLAILLGLAIVVRREALARFLFPRPEGRLEVPGALGAALSVLGCWLVVQGLSGFPQGPAFRWAALIQVVLGFALFVGGPGLARFRGTLPGST